MASHEKGWHPFEGDGTPKKLTPSRLTEDPGRRKIG